MQFEQSNYDVKDRSSAHDIYIFEQMDCFVYYFDLPVTHKGNQLVTKSFKALHISANKIFYNFNVPSANQQTKNEVDQNDNCKRRALRCKTPVV